MQWDPVDRKSHPGMGASPNTRPGWIQKLHIIVLIYFCVCMLSLRLKLRLSLTFYNQKNYKKPQESNYFSVSSNWVSGKLFTVHYLKTKKLL